MASPVSPTVAVQVFAEMPREVRAYALGDRVALTFGDDASGVRFMGDRDDLWRLMAQAGRALSEAVEE